MKFHISAILTVTHGRLLANPHEQPSGLDDVSKLLSYMTNDSAFTHQFERFASECKPYLFDQLPWLHNFELSAAIANINETNWQSAVIELEKRYGAYHEIIPIHSEDHERIDPVDEWTRNYPDKPIIDLRDDSDDDLSPYGDINWKD